MCLQKNRYFCADEPNRFRLDFSKKAPFIRSLFLLSLLVAVGVTMSSSRRAKLVPLERLSELPIAPLNQQFGFNLNAYSVAEGVIQPNQFLADLLLPHHVSYLQISTLAAAARNIFDVRGLRAGKEFTILNADTSTCADYFIYEPGVLSYVVFDIKNAKVHHVERKVDRVPMTASGVIESSLWQTMMDFSILDIKNYVTKHPRFVDEIICASTGVRV